MHAESGQATVEWVALVLLAALVLTAAAAFSWPERDRELGTVLAERITRSARLPAAAPGRLAVPAPMAAPAPVAVPAPVAAPGPLAAPAPALAPRPQERAARAPAAPPTAARAPTPAARAPAPVAQARAPAAPAPDRPARPPGPKAVDAFRRLRGLAGVAKHAWIICLGYRRWRHELEHPRAPTEPLPLGVALRIANDCLNPYNFLLEG
jgi:hypothetical protein